MQDIIKADAATMARAVLAAEALVWWLGTDSRVQGAYRAWRDGHGLVPGAVVTRERLKAIASAKDQDIQILDRLVREDLGLEYQWLAPLLLFDFAATAVGLEGTRVTPQNVGLPAGRRLKNDGKEIARDVEWFYRAKVKTPRDTPYKIAQEYALAERRHTPAHSVVYSGIERAVLALGVLAIDGSTI